MAKNLVKLNGYIKIIKMHAFKTWLIHIMNLKTLIKFMIIINLDC